MSLTTPPINLSASIPALDARTLESPTQEGPAPGAAKFSDTLKNFIGEVNELDKQAGAKSDDFAAGRSNDIHGTMIAGAQADISFRLLASVRNRVVETYREVMRMGS